ncbi:hypothetical protein GCM10027259_23930 [Micromonospora palomenae]
MSVTVKGMRPGWTVVAPGWLASHYGGVLPRLSCQEGSLLCSESWDPGPALAACYYPDRVDWGEGRVDPPRVGHTSSLRCEQWRVVAQESSLGW